MGLSALLLLASCTQDDLTNGTQGEPLPPGKYPLILTASGLEAVATPAQASTRSTVDGEWSGETVRVQIQEKWNGYKEDWNSAGNQTCTVASNGTMTKDKDDLDAYWQSSDETKAIRAWHVSGVDQQPATMSSYLHTVQTDQSGEGYAKSDFLFAQRTANFAEGKDGVSLTFCHQVAKVRINIVRGDETPADFNVTGLRIDNVYIKGKFTAPDMAHTGEDAYGEWSDEGQIPGNITAHAVDEENTGDNIIATFEAIVIPQKVRKNNKLFTITNGYSNFAYTPTDDKEWEAGWEYTYTVAIKGSKLDVSVSESIGWGTDGNTGSGSVTLD